MSTNSYKVILVLGMLSASHAGFLDDIGLGNSTCDQSPCLVFPNFVAGFFPFNIICSVPEPLRTAVNLFCNADCRCTHGAASGGACAPNPSVPSTQACICNYANPGSKDLASIVTDIQCNALNLGPGRLVEFCGTIIQGIDGGILCQNDCGCFHAANGTCKTDFGVYPNIFNPLGQFSYCKCEYSV